ncbi:MAG: F0F1 ATP synthase subunit A [Thermacetogeniaceae bacterium]
MESGSEIVFYMFGWPITSYITTMWGIMVVLLVIGFIVSSRLQKVPGRFQMLAEYALGGLLNFFSSMMGQERARRYFPLLGTLFLFILFSNWSGILPGAGHITGFHPPTSTWSVTAALAIVVFVSVQFIGIREKGWHYFGRFFQPIPLMFPLEVIQELVKPLSLSLRLYGNIYGEEMVAAVLLSLAPYFSPIPMQLLGLLFGFIQALVFTTLTAIYIGQATAESH